MYKTKLCKMEHFKNHPWSPVVSNIQSGIVFFINQRQAFMAPTTLDSSSGLRLQSSHKSRFSQKTFIYSCFGS